MSRARILLLVVALVAGGLAAYLATRGSAPPEPTTVTQLREEPKTQVLVASRAIGVGERLDTTNLDWQDWPQGAIRPEYVTIAAVPEAPQQLTGAVARFEFFPGEPIREAKLARADQGYLSAVLAKGMRGVSIDVTASSGAGGFIVPNDRVDVVLTQSTVGGERSETILRNVKVLAIGTRLGETGRTGGDGAESAEDPQSQSFTNATIATLELTPNQSEMLINSREKGSLTLILRSITDFAEKIDPQNYGGGATIRMIRFGNPVELTAGGEGASPGAADPTSAPVIDSGDLTLSPAAPATASPPAMDGPGPGGGLPQVAPVQ